MRRVFLWAARNSWLKAHLPGLWFMRRAVRRFMPGETMDDALKAADPLQAAGIGTLFTRLGENLESLAEADAVAAHYLELTRPERGGRAPRRGLGQADAARPRHRPGRLPRERPPPGRARGRSGLAPGLDRHGGQRLHRGDASRSTSSSRRTSRRPASASRRTSSARPPTSSGCCPSTRRSGWSRAPTTSRRRSPTATVARSTPTTSALAVRSCSTVGAKPIRLGLGTHDAR